MRVSTRVKITNGYDKLACVELDNFLGESLVLEHDLVKLSTPDERHHEVETHIVLEQVVHAHDEWMITFKHDIFFKDC